MLKPAVTHLRMPRLHELEFRREGFSDNHKNKLNPTVSRCTKCGIQEFRPRFSSIDESPDEFLCNHCSCSLIIDTVSGQALEDSFVPATPPASPEPDSTELNSANLIIDCAPSLFTQTVSNHDNTVTLSCASECESPSTKIFNTKLSPPSSEKISISSTSPLEKVIEAKSDCQMMCWNSLHSQLSNVSAFESLWKEKEFQFHTDVDVQTKYRFAEVIGKGKFGSVYRVTSQDNSNWEFAAKMVPYRSNESRQRISDEIDILCALRGHSDNDCDGSSHIILLVEAFECLTSRPKTVTLITELLSGGELFEEVAREEYLTESEVVAIMCQILLGVGYIHSRAVIHRDLKPENFVYDRAVTSTSTNERGQPRLLKIIDFGLSVLCGPDKSPPKSMVGTTLFVAPEVLRFEPQTFQTDMWSLGVIAYNLLAGITPFEVPRSGDLTRHLSDNEIIENIERGQYDFEDEGFEGVSENAKDFINKLLIRNPKKRMTAKESLQHSWLLPDNIESPIRPTDDYTDSMTDFQIRSVSVQRMKTYVSLKHWKKIGLAIQSVNCFKNAIANL